MPLSLIQYRKAVGMFENIFAKKDALDLDILTVDKYNRMNLV